MTETVSQSNEVKPPAPTMKIRKPIGILVAVFLWLLSFGLLVGGALYLLHQNEPQVTAVFACLVIFMMLKRLPKGSNTFLRGFDKGFRAYEAERQPAASPAPEAVKERGSSILSVVVVLTLLSAGAYFAYVSGISAKLLAIAGETNEKIIESRLSAECEVKNATWEQGYTWLFDWTVTADVWVTNKTSATIKATVVAEVFSFDRKILLSKAEQLVVGPGQSRYLKFLITEAEEKDKNYYKECNIRVSKVD